MDSSPNTLHNSNNNFHGPLSPEYGMQRTILALHLATLVPGRVNEVMSGKCAELFREQPRKGGEGSAIALSESNSLVFKMN